MRHFAAGESLFTAAQAELKAATIEARLAVAK